MSETDFDIEDFLYQKQLDLDEGSDFDNGEDSYDFNYPTSSAVDYVKEAQSIIYANQNYTKQNALALNQHLREYLRELKWKLEDLLQNCREKYKSYELLIERIVDESNESKKDLQSTSFFFCGKPYFKQMDLFCAPLNSDYVYRKNVQHEYFTIDYLDIIRPWNAEDKLFLMNGVKGQLKKFLMSNTRQGSILEDRSLESKKLNELFEMVKAGCDFKIDWFTISTKDLADRHSVNECVGIWTNNLMPSLKQLPWTDEDDKKLLKISDKFNCQNWNIIGEEMNGRSGYDCIIRYQGIINDQSILKNCRWTKIEDQLLTEAVETCRIGSYIPWSKVADKLPLRAKFQVYNRYMFTLKPDIKKEKFTVEEDCIITEAVQQYGTNFNEFSTNLLPTGRTLPQIRHRYSNVLKHVNNFKEWTVEDDIKLMELTKELGTANWVNISKHLIHHTRLSCRTRYMTITKFLEKNPNSKVEDVTRRARKQSTMTGLTFHEFFKFSYNFELKQLCEADDPASDKCRFISYMLQSTVYPKDHKLFYGPTGCRIDISSMATCEDSKEYTLPPNWSTALILRGLSILYPDTRKKPDRVFENTPALQLFKKRFFLMLYSSAVASHTILPDCQSMNNSILSTDFGTQSKRNKM